MNKVYLFVIILLFIYSIAISIFIMVSNNRKYNKYKDCEVCKKNFTLFLGQKEYEKYMNVVRSGTHSHITDGIASNTIVKYENNKTIKNMVKTYKKAKKQKLDHLLTKPIAHGNNFIIYQKCDPITKDNIPSDWREQVKEIYKLKKIGIYDFHPGNLMYCDDRIKMVDQTPEWMLHSKRREHRKHLFKKLETIEAEKKARN